MNRSLMYISLYLSLFSTLFLLLGKSVSAQNLESELLDSSVEQLVQQSRDLGDAKRGAVTFFQVYLSCSKCHSVGEKANPLGPDLTKLGNEATDQYLIESILTPSRIVKKGFESVTVVTADGKQFTGLIKARNDSQLILNDVSRPGVELKFAVKDVDEVIASKTSIMPKGQVNQPPFEKPLP